MDGSVTTLDGGLLFNIQVPLLVLNAVLIHTFVIVPQQEPSPAPPSNSSSRSAILDSLPTSKPANRLQTWKTKLARIDYLGSFTLALTVSLLLLAMSIKTSATKFDGSDYAFSDPIIWGLFVCSGLFAITFLLVESRYSPEPILPLKLLTRRTPVAIALSSFTMVTVQFSVLYNIPLFFTIVQQRSSSSSGAHLLPNSILIGAGSLFVGWIMRRTGRYWWLGVDCAVLIVVSSIGMCFWKKDSPEWLTWVAQAPGGFGYAGVLTTSLVALMTHVQRAGKGET